MAKGGASGPERCRQLAADYIQQPDPCETSSYSSGAIFTFLAFRFQGFRFGFFTYNRFHRAKGLGVANEITSWFNTATIPSKISSRCGIQWASPQRLPDESAGGQLFRQDSSVEQLTDTIPYDTLGHYRHYLVRDAQVVYNTAEPREKLSADQQRFQPGYPR